MFPYSADPATEDPSELDHHADQDILEHRWNEFIADMRAAIDKYGLSCMLLNLALSVDKEMDGALDYELMARQFASEYGWDGVLRCVARAITEAKGEQK